MAHSQSPLAPAPLPETAMTVAPLALVPGSSPTATCVPGMGGLVWSTLVAFLLRQMNLTRLSLRFQTTFRPRASTPCSRHRILGMIWGTQSRPKPKSKAEAVSDHSTSGAL